MRFFDRRRALLTLAGWALWVALVSWTLRVLAQHPVDDAHAHYLPLSGTRLFALTGGPGGAYAVSVEDVGCEQDRVSLDGELRCGGYRFFVRQADGRQRLVLEGLAVPIPSTIGSALDADFVFSGPGVGARHLEVLPASACSGEDGSLLCVRNKGARGTLIIDRSARQSPTAPLAATRLALAHDEVASVDERDLVWVGLVPFRVRVKEGLALFSVPRDNWTTLAGDRRWMDLELPSWPLAAADAQEPETHAFYSREVLHRAPVFPFTRMHLARWRVEHEQEEYLQAFVDHELLCFDAASMTLRWNLDSPSGCSLEPRPLPPADIYKLAEKTAFLPGTIRLVEEADRALQRVRGDGFDPTSTVFVFDWAFSMDESGTFERTPTRLLGIRPGSTKNGPPPSLPVASASDACGLSTISAARPPIDLAKGSTSPWLEVVSDGVLASGTVFVLPQARHSSSSPEPVGTLCVWSGPAVPSSFARVDRGADHEFIPVAVVLGQAHLRAEGAGKHGLYWSSQASGELPKGATGTCLRFSRTPEGFLSSVRGAQGNVHLEGTIPETTAFDLRDGDRVRIGASPDDVEIVVHDPPEPDRAAYDVVEDGRFARRYPFGRALSPVIGYGPLGGGIEGAGTAALWSAARERWKTTSCGESGEPEGIETTLRGDLERILATELFAMTGACQKGDSRCPEAGTDVSGSAVLMDANTGKLLAVANAPAFDPLDPLDVERLTERLRLSGVDGTARAPTLENTAFTRARHVGSVYKLATSYALARQGMLDGPATQAAPFGCTRFTWYAQNGEPETHLVPTVSPDGARSQPCGKAAVVLKSPAAGFHDAFRQSINVFFGLIPLAVVPGSGVRFGQPHTVTSLTDAFQNPLGAGSGLWAWSHETESGRRTDLGVTLSPKFDLAKGLTGSTNEFIQTLVRLGHRFYYALENGGVFTTQYAEAVGDVRFPGEPWLRGLRAGQGFRYPSIPGPETFAIEGIAGWHERQLRLDVTRNGVNAPVDFLVSTSTVRDYSRLAYGMGGVEASALSLAVMAGPMAREDGAVVAPDIIAAPAQGSFGRLFAPGVVTTGRGALVKAMRAVVSEPGSTAYGHFSPEVAKRIGGKTGTFEISRPTYEVASTEPEAWRSLETLVRYGCGVRGARVGPEDWVRVRGAVEARAKRYRRYLDERPYVLSALEAIGAGRAPSAGFAASADACTAWALNPGRPGVGQRVAEVDGGLWLDGLLGVFPLHPDQERVEGSSFVGVVFDGLADATPSETPPGKGWVLAVIMDGHPSGAKRVAARVFDRLRQYAVVDVAPGSEP